MLDLILDNRMKSTLKCHYYVGEDLSSLKRATNIPTTYFAYWTMPRIARVRLFNLVDSSMEVTKLIPCHLACLLSPIKMHCHSVNR